MKNWGPKNFDSYHTATVKLCTDRKSHSKEVLSKIRCPVTLVHCLEDVAYPLEYTEVFLHQLEEACVDVSIAKIEHAPHFGITTKDHE